ncbi:hypothetical protein HYV44_02830 [Candidatus Microgenomates bacterium]|nr:hypothetical protein [Candidatus Microgenomates bacterium]
MDMSKERRNALMLRWSLLTAGLIATILLAYYWVTGEVPVTDQIFWSKTKEGEKIFLQLPFGISRWWDVLLGPIWSCAFIAIMADKRSKDGHVSDLIAGLGAGLIFGLGFGLIYDLSFGLGYGLVPGLVLGLGFGLIIGMTLRLVFGLVPGLVFGLGYGLVFGLVPGLVLGLGFGLAAALGFGLVFELGATAKAIISKNPATFSKMTKFFLATDKK